MVNIYSIKSTFFILVLMVCSCGNPDKSINSDTELAMVEADSILPKPVTVAANRTSKYLPLLKGKTIGVVANQTSVIFKNEIQDTGDVMGANANISARDAEDMIDIIKNGDAKRGGQITRRRYTHLVDSLLSMEVSIKKVFAPEHGFRGKADAGEYVKNSKDSKTGLPLISLHGKTRKPSAQQLKGLDIVVFDIQDVGVRFYTYIATLQLVMEACAENKIQIIVLDRPNPNAHYIDGPTMKAANTGFLGMTRIPLVYGMTIGEYAQMINEEGWLQGKVKADLTVIPLENWDHKTKYSLTIRPSPNLPDDTAINLYPSLGLFEGTNINAGRGTESQFKRYGASFLDSTQYSFTYIPMPNFGSKAPKEKGEKCFGKDLSEMPRMQEVSLEWVIDAYTNAVDKTKVFNTDSFTKHVGTENLQIQIEAGKTVAEIRESWQSDITEFMAIRKKYLRYKD